MSKVKENEFEKAYFVSRFVAFLLDILIVGFIASILTLPFQTESVQKLNNEAMDASKSYINQEISSTVYINKSIDINYQLAKATGISKVITILIYVIYFIVIQKKMNGQTIGKKIMKIKVIKDEEEELTTNDLLFRSLINNSIFCNILIVIFALINKNVCFYGTSIVQLIHTLVVLISAFMVIIRKDGKTIADLVAKTKVVKMEE